MSAAIEPRPAREHPAHHDKLKLDSAATLGRRAARAQGPDEIRRVRDGTAEVSAQFDSVQDWL